MAVSLKHKFASAKTDGGDTSLVRPSNWNDEHDLLIDASKIVGRTTAGTGSAEEIGVSSELTLTSGTLGVAASLDGKTFTGPVTITSGTQTVSTPALAMTQTWNNAATTFTGYNLNVTDTASNAASLLMDLQVGGASRFNVTKAGAAYGESFGTNSSNEIRYAVNSLTAFANGVNVFQIRAGAIRFISAFQLSWTDSTSPPTSNTDLILTRKAAASLRLGAPDAAAPIAQTFGVQSVVAGTTNTAGANFTIAGSQGTGTGAGGSIVFQVAPAGSSGTAQNALVPALTIAGNRTVTIGPCFIGDGLVNESVILRGGEYNGVFIGGNTSATSAVAVFGDNLGGGVLRVTPQGGIGWSNGVVGASLDTVLRRDAANTIAQRNGVNAQAFRLYNTYTDASNYERGVFGYSANVLQIGHFAAGTGTASRRIQFHNGGVSRLQIETNGWVTVRDALAGEGSVLFFGINAATRVGGFDTSSFVLRDTHSTIKFGADGSLTNADVDIRRVSAGVLRLSQNGTTTGGSLELVEQTAPAAPAANNVRIYAEDNGSGKTRLMAIFATGAAQQIAIEP